MRWEYEIQSAWIGCVRDLVNVVKEGQWEAKLFSDLYELVIQTDDVFPGDLSLKMSGFSNPSTWNLIGIKRISAAQFIHD